MSQALESPDGTALTWIFDHILRYPGTYEIPLRTMYTLNCNPSKSSGPSRPETAFSARSSTSTSSSSSEENASIDAALDFRSQLMHQMSRLPSQPCSLPASFLTSFVRRTFASELESVDFPQALTALDYLKDLENRWKKEMTGAYDRLGLTREDVEAPFRSELAIQHPEVMAWHYKITVNAKHLEALYTQIYIGLRRWTLINDMMLDPHNRPNNLAMLNTLFPPTAASSPSPTKQLTPTTLLAQRDGFFRYVKKVDAEGPAVLDHLITQHAPEGHATSWPLVHDVLEKFLVAANEMIEETMMIKEPADLNQAETFQRPKTRKADSGISFGSTATNESATNECAANECAANESVTVAALEKPLPQFPVPKPQGKAAGSALERLVTEFRRLGPSNKSKNLKKMKSSSALQSRPGSQHSSAESSFFEIDEQKRRRLIGEATSRKAAFH
ncbi:hypothetical protein N7470_001959 [Penicillium chermesinum]|nr:hypothetical protein N7470_001959 [Penicillium chermesinum]